MFVSRFMTPSPPWLIVLHACPEIAHLQEALYQRRMSECSSARVSVQADKPSAAKEGLRLETVALVHGQTQNLMSALFVHL